MKDPRSVHSDHVRAFATRAPAQPPADTAARPPAILPPWSRYALAALAALAILALAALAILALRPPMAAPVPTAAPAPTVAAAVPSPSPQAEAPTSVPCGAIEPIDCAAPRDDNERAVCAPPAPAPVAAPAPAPAAPAPAPAPPAPAVASDLVPIIEPAEAPEEYPTPYWGRFNGGGGSWGQP